MKGRGQKITALTAYDYSFARILDQAGIDILLVGDSLGSVIQGQENTLPVTLEDMIYHTRAVVRGRSRALVVTDMPFLSYQVSVKRQTQRRTCNSGREGRGGQAPRGSGAPGHHPGHRGHRYPVMGHLGLTPQWIHRFGGYKVQGRENSQKTSILQDAMAVEAAGVFAVVLEGMPADLADEITQRLSIPTIGIGAGVRCDGQVLVIHDLLGLFDLYTPKFVKQYANLKSVITQAVQSFVTEVKEGKFPDEKHSFH